MLDNPFDVCITRVIGFEGGYTNDPDDPGGETKFGISKRQFPELSIKDLSLAEARRIYKYKYWRVLNLDQVNDINVCLEILDTAVNMGNRASGRITQRALNFLGEWLQVDGNIGPITITAINRWCRKDPQAFLKALNGFQFIRYAKIIERWPKLVKYGRGWMKRIQSYKEAA